MHATVEFKQKQLIRVSLFLFLLLLFFCIFTMPHNTSDNESNIEEIGDSSRSILLAIAAQLTKGTDLVCKL